MHGTVELTASTHKGPHVNCLENLYIQIYQHTGILINEQTVGKYTPLHEVIQDIQMQHICT
jgi:hypothetical protein